MAERSLRPFDACQWLRGGATWKPKADTQSDKERGTMARRAILLLGL